MEFIEAPLFTQLLHNFLKDDDLTRAEKRILKAAIQKEAHDRATRKTQRRN